MSDLEKLLVEVRRIAEHRSVGAEKEITKQYQSLLKDLQSFLGTYYMKYEELSFEVLQQKREYARFIEEVAKKVDGLSQKTVKAINSVVNDVYKITYDGMTESTKKATGLKLKSLGDVSGDIVKQAVQNPVSGLTLSDNLEKNRKDIIYDIKKQVTIGLNNNDRPKTMADRMKTSLEDNYNKSLRITRTETHRVHEAGFQDSALSMNDELKANGFQQTKTWKDRNDSRVRRSHSGMDGVTIPVDEDFDVNGHSASAPGQTGVAKEDIHCRCYLSYDIKELELKHQDYSERLFGKFEDKEVREWYIEHDEGILNKLDKNLSLKEQSMQAHFLRNKYRSEARLMMKDREKAEFLEKSRPNLTFEDLIQHKKTKYGLTDDEACKDIIRSSQTTNKEVNKKLGLEK